MHVYRGGSGSGGGGGGGGTRHIPPTPTDIRHTSSITKFQYCYSRSVATLELYDTSYTYLWKAAET